MRVIDFRQRRVMRAKANTEAIQADADEQLLNPVYLLRKIVAGASWNLLVDVQDHLHRAIGKRRQA